MSCLEWNGLKALFREKSRFTNSYYIVFPSKISKNIPRKIRQIGSFICTPAETSKPVFLFDRNQLLDTNYRLIDWFQYELNFWKMQFLAKYSWSFHPLQPVVAFPYPLKTSENLKVFTGLWKSFTRLQWVKVECQ